MENQYVKNSFAARMEVRVLRSSLPLFTLFIYLLLLGLLSFGLSTCLLAQNNKEGTNEAQSRKVEKSSDPDNQRGCSYVVCPRLP